MTEFYPSQEDPFRFHQKRELPIPPGGTGGPVPLSSTDRDPHLSSSVHSTKGNKHVHSTPIKETKPASGGWLQRAKGFKLPSFGRSRVKGSAARGAARLARRMGLGLGKPTYEVIDDEIEVVEVDRKKVKRMEKARRKARVKKIKRDLKAVAAAKKDTKKDELALRKAALKKRKIRIKELKAIYQGRGTYDDDGHFVSKKKASLSLRMAMYLELQNQEKYLIEEKQEIKELESDLQGRAKRALGKSKSAVGTVWTDFQRLGGTGRSGGVSQSDTTGFNPITWVTAIKDGNNVRASATSLIRNQKRQMAVKAMIKEGEQRIVYLNARIASEAKKGGHGERTTEYKILAKELEIMKEGVAALKAEKGLIPVSRDRRKLTVDSVKLAFSGAKVTQAFCTMLPLLMGANNAVSTVGIAAGVVTIPLSAVLTTLGIATTYENMKDAKKDVRFAQGLDQGGMRNMRQNALSLTFVGHSRVAQNPSVRPVLENAFRSHNLAVINARKEMWEIDNALIRGDLPSEQIPYAKARRDQLMHFAMREHQAFRQEVVAMKAHYPGLEDQFDALIKDLDLRQGMADNALAFEQTIGPYIRQRAQDKVVGEWVHAAADGLAAVGTAFAAVGFVTTVLGGSGASLLLVGAGLGFASVGVRYGGGFLTRKIRQMQRGDSNIKSENFDAAVLDRMKYETEHWDEIQAAGLEQTTTSYMMFGVMKKHYQALPKEWGPKEWATSLVTDVEKGKDRKAFTMAREKISYHDSARFLRHLTKPLDRLIGGSSGGRDPKAVQG